MLYCTAVFTIYRVKLLNEVGRGKREINPLIQFVIWGNFIFDTKSENVSHWLFSTLVSTQTSNGAVSECTTHLAAASFLPSFMEVRPKPNKISCWGVLCRAQAKGRKFLPTSTGDAMCSLSDIFDDDARCCLGTRRTKTKRKSRRVLKRNKRE